MIWLTGYRGLLGSEIYNVLTKNNIKFLYSDSELELSDLDKITQVVKYYPLTYIINCAGISAIDKCEDDQTRALKSNTEAVNNLVQIAKSKNATLIHICSEHVFYGDKFDPYIESDECEAKNYYGSTKLLATQNIISEYDKYIILRTSALFGKHGINYVYEMLKLFGAGAKISSVDDMLVTPTFSLDVAKIIVYIIMKDLKHYGLYHCSNTESIDWYSYSQEILAKAIKYNILPGWIKKQTSLKPISINESSLADLYPQYSNLDSSKLISTFNIPLRSWEESLDHFFRLIQKGKSK